MPSLASRRTAALVTTSCLFASVVFADVRITVIDTSRGMPGAGTPPSTTTYVKDGRQRVDRGPSSTIIDLDASRATVIDHDARTAIIYALSDLRPRQHARAQVRVDVEVTEAERRFGDVMCHEARVSVVNANAGPLAAGAPPIRQRDVTTGFVWLATEGPGVDDYRAFNRRLADFGAVVTDFEMSRLDSAGTVTQATFSTAIAVEGIPCAAQLSTVSLGVGTDGQALVPSHSTDWRIGSIAVDPLDDAVFDIPAGYHVQSTVP